MFLDRISFFISVLSQNFSSKSCNSHDPVQSSFKTFFCKSNCLLTIASESCAPRHSVVGSGGLRALCRTKLFQVSLSERSSTFLLFLF